MDSVTRGSGIALSVLIAATASIVLLLPGKPSGSWRGPGTSGRIVMASAVATSTWTPPGPGSRPAASSRAGGQAAAGPRPGCRAAGAHRGRARPGLTTPGPGRARPGAAWARSCRAPGARRDQDTFRR
jgi:hypothetical protein